jgi:serine/threonine protein kinase
MAVPGTSPEFLELVRKSGLLDEKRLDTHLAKLRAAGSLADDPGKLAGLLVRDGLLTHFQAEQLLQGKWRRFTIGKYKVLERLGSGGMGSVYLCEHKLMRRRVAVKVLPTAKAADESALQRFYREARAAAALDHPNIVHAYDIDQDETLHFLVMEYVDGASLQEVVKKSGPMGPGRAAHYIRQAALGLDHAHRAGLVHRDIKPGNLLLDRQGTVKVLDMGLARFFNDEDDILTRKFEENVLGTADYLAPEQAVDSHTVDIRADIYSLGATFYFLLTGKTPFGEGSVAQKLIWHQTRQAKPITTYRADVPEEMRAIIDTMMAKDPDQRYQTPAAVADALAPWTQTPPAPPAESEMPRLSPAATGAATAAEATVVTSRPSSPASPAPRKSWSIATPASGNTKVSPQPTPAKVAPASPPPAPRRPPEPPTPHAPAVPVPPLPVLPALEPQRRDSLPAPAAIAPTHEEGPAPWERLLADDTSAHVALSDTGPDSVLPVGPSTDHADRKKKAGPDRKRHRRQWVVVGIAGAFLLVLAVLLVLYFRNVGPEKQVTERKPLLVSRQGGAGTFASVQQALHAAREGDVIELLDEEHQENLLVAAPKRVTLQAHPGKSVVWTCRKGKETTDPLLRLSGAAGFHFKGQGITLDGQGKVKDLIVLALNCSGLTVEGVRLQGFTKSAIRVVNCTGSKSSPVRIREVTTFTAAGEKPVAAITFDARPDITPVVNEFIDISASCRFLGLPTQSAIQRSREDVTGADVQLPAGFPWSQPGK